MMVTLHIPGEPQGKQRTKYNSRTKTAYNQSKTRAYEAYVKRLYLQKYGGDVRYPANVAVKMKLIVGYGIPPSDPKWKREKKRSGAIRPTKKPDADNVLKMIADSLNGLCYRDDAQLVDAEVHKYYTDQPGVDVMIWELE